MRLSKWYVAFLMICFVNHNTAHSQCSDTIASACQHIAAACEELAGICEEDCNDSYIPLEGRFCWGDISFYAEYIWWHIYQQQLHFAVTGVQNVPPCEGELFALNGDWGSGFRIGAGIIFPFNSWKLTLDWLCLRNEEEKGVSAGSGLILRATRGLPMGVDSVAAAFATFDFKLDMIQLLVQVPLFTRLHLALKPLAGIRADRISEDFGIVYTSTNAIFNNQLSWWGIGPEAGLETAWYFFPTFALFGKATVAGLYGNYEIHQIGMDSTGNEDVNIGNRFDNFLSTFSAILGVQWDGVFFRDIYISLKLGWETNVWFNLNSVYTFTDPTIEGSLVDSRGDLRTNGLTFYGSIAF